MTDFAASPAGLAPASAQDKETLHAGGAAAWDISDEVLAVIARETRPGMATLETGAGQSTLAFLEAGANHTAVTPSAAEVAAIRREAERRGLDAGRLSVLEGYSQEVLAGQDGALDIVLIDGGHGFPVPAMDWAYLAPRIKPGGLIIVDDVDLWTGAMLKDFMKADPAFAYEGTLRGRTAVFRLTAPFQLREWTNQPYVVARSRWPQRWRKARNLAGLVLRGDFRAIAGKVSNERRLADAARDDY